MSKWPSNTLRTKTTKSMRTSKRR